jgi:SHS2 domain-containing protein
VARHCETFDHTADVGLCARADTLGELFVALAEGLCDVVCPRENVTPASSRGASAAADDVGALVVDFLNEVLWAVQTDHFAVAAVRVAQVSETAVTAELLGEPYDAARHEMLTEVKAVTYHQLKVATGPGGWIARVIMDI